MKLKCNLQKVRSSVREISAENTEICIRYSKLIALDFVEAITLVDERTLM